LKISIITVVYNNSKYIESNIDSIRSQDYEDYEHIIIDGGSTDGTADIVRKYSNTNIRFISEPDDGPYDAMNKGIRMAVGNIIGILNADDVYAFNDVLKEVAHTFDHNGVESVYGDLVYTDSSMSKNIRYWKSGGFYHGIMDKGWMPPHPTFFVKRELYDRLGLFDLSYEISADYELMLRFLHKNRISTHYIPEVLVKMRAGGKSYKVRNYLIKYREDLRAMNSNKISSPFQCLLFKNLGKLSQFFYHKKI